MKVIEFLSNNSTKLQQALIKVGSTSTPAWQGVLIDGVLPEKLAIPKESCVLNAAFSTSIYSFTL
eukprot:1155358-Pelagomonas_calceolata.AAC.1